MYNYKRLDVSNFNELSSLFLSGHALCRVSLEKEKARGMLNIIDRGDGCSEKNGFLYAHLLFLSEYEPLMDKVVFILLKEAVLKGNIQAFHDLGLLFLELDKADMALPFFQRAAYHGFLPSSYEMGRLMLREESVTKEERVSAAISQAMPALDMEDEDVSVFFDYCNGVLNQKKEWGSKFVQRLEGCAYDKKSFSTFLLANSYLCGFFSATDYDKAKLYMMKLFKGLANDSMIDALDLASFARFAPMAKRTLENGREISPNAFARMITGVK